MKKQITGLVMLMGVVGLVLAGCDNQSSENAAAQSEQTQVLKIGATGQSYPNSFKQDDKLVGFDVEVTEAIANELGYKVEWVNAEFGGLMAQLEAGRLDTVANAVAVTEARQQRYNFTIPYSYYGSQVVTNTANTDINTLEDLPGKTISGVLGSNHINVLRNAFPNNEVNIRTYETRDGAMYDLVYNRVDGYVNSKPILLAEIKRNNLPFKLVGEPLVIEEVAYPFEKNAHGDELRAKFNQAIEKLSAEGVISKISIKYYGEDISSK
ncbi:amino acid ABC transporter substrate-binding protein [Zophobihabitans entericus]|uniref:Amino acid ABC transporter substrate-binding protein n=1 Tax=Zophobihabitans entericus TaxID=1635327 RepID=A0A6G9IBM8_9GAMM|nr:amino acid ABC transporter substrate-binding protein [Zophobihabitans entericus]QIQ21229.1 amino acid ABC transporter substrate-binding protein [Zophobihabitans entericus]